MVPYFILSRKNRIIQKTENGEQRQEHDKFIEGGTHCVRGWGGGDKVWQIVLILSTLECAWSYVVSDSFGWERNRGS
jgi:hypothetical protein